MSSKGLHELVMAFREVCSRHPSAWLVLVGDGPLKADLEKLAKEQRLGDNIFIVGSCPHDEVACWMNAADVFVLASHAEGLPNVVLEAMACGRPVIATNVGGIPEAALDNVTALLVPPRQAAPLAATMDRLVRDADLRAQLGAAGRARVATHFTWPQSARQLAEIYSETIERRTKLISSSTAMPDEPSAEAAR